MGRGEEGAHGRAARLHCHGLRPGGGRGGAARLVSGSARPSHSRPRLSRAHRAHHRADRGRRLDRHHRARHRRGARRALGQAGGDRESPGRRHDHRRGSRRQVAVRRLHAFGRPRRHHGDEPGRLPQSRLPLAARLRAARAAHLDRGGRAGERGGAGQVDPRADRVRQGQSGQAQSCLWRDRDAACARIVQGHGPSRHHQHPVPGRRAGGHRRDVGRDPTSPPPMPGCSRASCARSR